MRSFYLFLLLLFSIFPYSIQGGLKHRYSFTDSGVLVSDLVSGRTARVIGGATMAGDGSLTLDGVNDYILLPGGILSSYPNATLESWVTWRDQHKSEWQNIFYFGNSRSHWMFLSPNSQGTARFAVAIDSAEIRANAPSTLSVSSAEPMHLVVTIDDSTHQAKVYLDGVLLSEATRVPTLTTLDDSTNSLGKPIFSGFPTFEGTFYEFRIHDRVFSPQKVQQSYLLGPDFPPGPEISSFSVDKTIVRSNEEVTFSWEASEGSVVEIVPGAISGAAEVGSVTVPVPESTTYTLRATDEDGLRTADLVVEVDDRPIINSFAVDTSRVNTVGDPITISWDVSYSDFVEITPNVPQIIGANGSIEIALAATTTFTLLAHNQDGFVSTEVVANLPELGQLKINEFVADNDEGLLDDHEEDSDWIEILNIGNQPIELDQWTLSDDPDELNKWSFPDGVSLAPHARMIVFASGRGEPGPDGALHTNFKLDAGSGSYLALIREDGVIGSLYADLPKLDENRSLGRLEQGNLPEGGKIGDLALFLEPTPGEPNQDGYLGQVKDTKFNYDRGFYTKRFELEIETATPDAEIYYTLNGTDPSPTNGFLYSSPLHIRNTTALRAAAFKEGMLPSNIDTQSYLFLNDVIRQSSNGTPPEGWPTSNINNQHISYGMDPDVVFGSNTAAEVVEALKSISTLSIVIDLDHLFDSRTGIFTNARSDGRAWERPASMELLHPDGTEGFQSGIGLRIRGGYSRSGNNPKHSFRVFFRSDYGNGQLNYKMFEDEGTDRFDKFDLRTSQNFSWAFGGPSKNTMVREVFSRDLQGEMGQPYTRSRYYHLYLNAQYWGIFMTQERVGKHFCANYNGGEPEDYDVLKQGDGRIMTATAGQIDDYNLFHDQAVVGFEDDANYYMVQGLNPDGVTPNPEYRKYLDVDNLADYMTITYWTGDRDGPGSKFTRPRPNNFYAFFNRENPDGFKFMEHDSEHSLGANENPMDMVNPLLTRDQRTWNKSYFNAHWLHERLTENAEYRMQFADRVYKHFYNDGLLTVDKAIARIDKRAQQIDKAIIAESARWGDQKTHPPQTRTHWLANVEAVRSWIRTRTPTVISQFRGHNWYPSIQPPDLSITGGKIEPTDSIELSQISGKAYYTLDGSDPRLPGGAISSSAIEYSAPFQLPNNQSTLKVRSLNAGEWSPLRENTYIVGAEPATPETLAITEINYNPAAPTVEELLQTPTLESSDFEYIELMNIGSSPVNLVNAEFTDGVFLTLPDVAISPQERVLVVNNLAAFQMRYGLSHTVVGEFEGSLKNSGELVILLDSVGNTVSRIDYEDGGDWPGRADGKGSSLEILDPSSDPSDPNNWRSSSEYGGTPGGDGLGPDNRIVINEVLTHTDPPLTDSIELLNTTDQAQDISGWYLSDTAENFKKYQFPDNTILAAGAYLVIDETDFNPDPTNPSSNGFALSSSKGDSVWLVEADAEGNVLRFVDHVEFPAARNAEPFGRWPNSTGKLYPLFAYTPGAPNATPRVGPVLITEIHYSPRSDNPEHQYIEIANPSTDYISMANWKLRGGVDYNFPGWVVLAPNSLLLLVNFSTDDPDKLHDFLEEFPDIPANATILGPLTDGDLKPDFHNVRLLRPDELLSPPGAEPFYPMLIEEEFMYSSQAPWPTTALTNHLSLNRLNYTGWGFEATHWQPLLPTPGQHGNLLGDDTDLDGMSDVWELQHFGSKAHLPVQDYDRDALPNLLEYALGSDPVDPTSNIQIHPFIDDELHLSLTYRRLTHNPNLRYQIQIADTLGDWVAAEGLTEIVTTSQEGDYTIITVRDKSQISQHSSRFLRVQIETID